MASLLRLAVLIALAWAAVTYGWPRVKTFLDDPKVVTSVRSGNDGIGCVQAAQRAYTVFENGIVDFSKPPVDLEKWADLRQRVDGRRSEADVACGCPTDACRLAQRAMDELESLTRLFDSELRRGSYPTSAASQLTEIQALLDSARGVML